MMLLGFAGPEVAFRRRKASFRPQERGWATMWQATWAFLSFDRLKLAIVS